MSDLSRKLLSWYDVHARSLPWRGIRDPYRTWVSECMLQQTRVDTVIPYYLRFLERFPDLPSLAAAEEEDVLRLWQGLGYYSRARNLLRGARQVLTEYGGALPADPALLLKIQGIGPYTAGAIASIAFGLPVPAVDGNVSRVLSRCAGFREDLSLPASRERLHALAASLVPPDRPGDYNQALMDLGSAVCVPGTPDCFSCPLRGGCDAFRAGDAERLPLLPRSAPPRTERWSVLLIFSGNRVLMRRRTENLLRGMWCFPMLEEPDSGAPDPVVLRKRLRLSVRNITEAGSARHVFTHRIWQMRLWTMETEPAAQAPEHYVFVPPDELPALPVPAAMRAALALIPPSA